MTCRAAWAWRSRPPILFIATAEPNLCPTTLPRTWTGPSGRRGVLGPHIHYIFEGLGKGGLGVALMIGALLQAPYRS